MTNTVNILQFCVSYISKLSYIGTSKKKTGVEKRHKSGRSFKRSRNHKDKTYIIIVGLDNFIQAKYEIQKEPHFKHYM